MLFFGTITVRFTILFTMLTSQKHLFSLPDDVHYLNCAYMSPLSKNVEEAGLKGISKKRHPYLIGGDDFFTLPAEVRKLFATLVNADTEDSITLLPSVSYGMAVVAKNLHATMGQNIVTVEGEFPSNVYAWKSFIQHGVELRLVAPPERYSAESNPATMTIEGIDFEPTTRGERWNDAILNAIDENTALVVLCPIHWADGTYFDLEVIGDAARAVGALFVIDGTQSIGAMPFDIETVKPDAVIASSYKCMMGAYSIGCAYWGERFATAIPIEESWMGRYGSEDFRNLVKYQDQYQQGKNRLGMGEQSNFALVPMLKAALEQVLQWQPAQIQAYCATLNQPIIDFCKTNDLWLEEPHWRAEHLFGIRIDKRISVEKLQDALKKRNVFVSLRGDSIRISPNVYNTTEDIEALLLAIKESIT